MKKRILFLLVVIVLIAVACKEEQYLTCPDNITKVLDLDNCPKEKPKCPVCDDGNNCTMDKCSAATDYKCVFEEIKPCNNNRVCEEGEFPWSDDCPKSCDDNNSCTVDSYNYDIKRCYHEEVSPCCGNRRCETGETYVGCQPDCTQVLDIEVEKYEKRQRFAAGTDVVDLTGTEYIFLIVKFKIKNIGIDERETLDKYNYQKGFYYDPFKMRLEDDNGKLYNIEYDSDLVDDWMDYSIISKGDTRTAALMFIVPMSVKHVRLVAYNKYGSRLDISEVY